MIIEKKVNKKYFQDIIDGKKCFEIRLADFSCGIGDLLLLKEWDDINKVFTGRQIERKILYLVKTKDLNFWDNEEITKYGYQIIGFDN